MQIGHRLEPSVHAIANNHRLVLRASPAILVVDFSACPAGSFAGCAIATPMLQLANIHQEASCPLSTQPVHNAAAGTAVHEHQAVAKSLALQSVTLSVTAIAQRSIKQAERVV